MPAFDQCHDQVARAIQKEGWQIEDEPFRLLVPPRVGFVDLRVSRGQNGHFEQLMLIEVKCFPDEDSTTRDLYVSIGQDLVYRAMIAELDLPEVLYLAVPQPIFETIFDQSVMWVINESKIRLVIVNLETETIVQWIR
ncbi:MAG: element excision factor XisH family protein [Chloroflexota bacterium]